MFVVVAEYYAQPDREQAVVEALREMVAFSNSTAEPGCALYVVNQSLDDPRAFLLYEQYHDRAAFEAHTQTAAFQQHVLGTVVPLLERRERAYYQVISPA